LEKQPTASLKM